MTTDTQATVDIARHSYEAWSAADRHAFEALLSDDFTFSSPADASLDRAQYFERCWPAEPVRHTTEILQLFTDGHDVLVRYRASPRDRPAFVNTEFMTIEGGRITRVEVYFGCSLGDTEAG